MPIEDWYLRLTVEARYERKRKIKWRITWINSVRTTADSMGPEIISLRPRYSEEKTGIYAAYFYITRQKKSS